MCVEDTHTSELPTLLHLAAKFGLQELCARLTDLPDSSQAFIITNSSGQMPSDIARNNGHQELADFLDTFHETVRIIAITWLYSHGYNVEPTLCVNHPRHDVNRVGAEPQTLEKKHRTMCQWWKQVASGKSNPGHESLG